MPHLEPHPDDADTFFRKLRRVFSEKEFEQAIPVLAWLLCESLGEDPAEMAGLFSPEVRGLLLQGGLIVRDKGIDDDVRACLRDQLQISPWVIEVNDDPSLDRIAGLVASAIGMAISRVTRQAISL